MSQPASRDPLHYRLMEALDGPLSDDSAQNADLLANALRAVLNGLVDIERGLLSEVPRERVARNTRVTIAHALGIGTPWPQTFEPPKVER